MNHGFISGKDKRFPCPDSVQAICGARPASDSISILDAFPQEVKWSWYEADHLLPFSPKVKNTWNCTSMPVHVHAVTPSCLIKYKANLLVFNMKFAFYFIWLVLQNML